MLQIINIKCPQCGAIVDIDEGMKTCFCKYCGSKIMIDDGSTTFIHRTVDEARIKEAEVAEKIGLEKIQIEKSNLRLKRVLILLLIAISAMLLLVLYNQVNAASEKTYSHVTENTELNEETERSIESDEVLSSEKYEITEGNRVSGANAIGKNSSEILALYDELLNSGSDTEELYVTGDIVVGKDKDIKPGIYDMSFIGGTLNGYVNHSELGLTFYGEDDEVARLILFEGTNLEFNQVSKVKFTAVKKRKALSEYRQGQYLVGKDIEEGDYLVGTNGSLGDRGTWFIWIYSLDADGKYRMKLTQDYTEGNSDIAISLHEGDVLSLSADRWNCTGNIVLTKQ